MSLRKIPNRPLREGFTTGTSATAAATAALKAVIHQSRQEKVKVYLPIDKLLEVPVYSCKYGENWAKCSVIKDAGDDPDVTNGAEIGCEIQLMQNKDIRLIGGEGVGTVTLPGLEIAVGKPAINPVPRKMIYNALYKLLHKHRLECGVAVTIFVVNGKELAKKTLNERVGIMNGLSILGTTGIVKPYSASSYIASIVQGIDVAIANGIKELVLNSGARSEKYLRRFFPHLKEQAFIHYGNWIGETLHKIKQSPIEKVTIGIMLGKAVKLAYGKLDTHSCVSNWNKEFIVAIAEQCGYDKSYTKKISNLNIAGRLTELFPFRQDEAFYQRLLGHCYKQAEFIINQTRLNIFLIDKNGDFIKVQKI